MFEFEDEYHRVRHDLHHPERKHQDLIFTAHTNQKKPYSGFCLSHFIFISVIAMSILLYF
jgi:hypothetical protein